MSVEAFSNTRTVKGKTAGKAFRQTWEPTPTCVLDPNDLAPFVTLIAAAIAETKRARQCGTYLFIDGAGTAYLLPEEKPAALVWVRQRLHWLVALYEPHRGVGMDVDRLGEDVADHLQQIGVVA